MNRREFKYPPRANYTETHAETGNRRLKFLVGILLFWIFVIGLRLVFLQVVNTDWYRTQALLRQRKTVVTDPARGLILDRQGRELARTIDAASFFVIPGKIKDVNELSRQVTAVIGGDPHALAERVRRAKETKAKFAWVARKVDDTQAEQLRALAINGMDSRNEPKRIYPQGVVASHVLGFVSRDNAGLAGIERSHNREILGDEGKLFIESDAENRSYAHTVASTNGGDTVTLTLDSSIQFKVEQLLMQAVQTTGARSATAVVLDPNNGEIVALANYPNFDPNDPTGSEDVMRVNNALQNIYEPGSTFKIVAYAGALQEGKVTPDEQIDCLGGSITVAGRVIKDSGKYGVISATEALAKSSNVAAIRLGMRLGNQSMYDYARLFGFGRRTGIELPGESAGILRTPQHWQPSSIGSIAIGQEVAVTPMQITTAFGIIANDGTRVTPHLVREVRNDRGEVIFRAAATKTQILKPETARILRHMLESVTVKGTAKRAQLDGYSAAGKTGTAQKIDPRTGKYSPSKHVASFVGIAPVDHPAVVISVVIDEPGGAYHGGDVAAPVFRDIAEQVLPAMNVVPDVDAPRDPEVEREVEMAATEPAEPVIENTNESLPRVEHSGGKSGETVYVAASDRAMLMPDLRGRSLRDVASICAQMGIQLDARGNGRAVWQNPNKGRDLTIGQVVRVDFARSD
jgi:cell division protein FtsI/penicillin-binding protein 2